MRTFLYVFKPPCRAGARPEQARGHDPFAPLRRGRAKRRRARARKHGRTQHEVESSCHRRPAVGMLHPRDRRVIKAEPATVNLASRRSRSVLNSCTDGHAGHIARGAGSVTGLCVDGARSGHVRLGIAGMEPTGANIRGAATDADPATCFITQDPTSAWGNGEHEVAGSAREWALFVLTFVVIWLGFHTLFHGWSEGLQSLDVGEVAPGFIGGAIGYAFVGYRQKRRALDDGDDGARP